MTGIRSINKADMMELVARDIMFRQNPMRVCDNIRQTDEWWIEMNP